MSGKKRRNPGVAVRPRVFTDYVSSLGAGGEPPDRERFDRAWHELKLILRTELRRRNLWPAPPRYLGIVGSECWEETAIDELVADAYVFNFVERLRSLRAQLEVKPNIEGLVRLNVRNFLYDRQRRYDPLGCRLYGIVCLTLRELVEAGEIGMSGEDLEVRNDTVLHFIGASEEQRDGVPGTRAHSVTPLPELIAAWSDQLLPELVTARGGKHDALVSELRQRILDLRKHGYSRLTMKELLDPLRKAVRERWRALHLGSSDEGGPSSDGERGDDLFGAIHGEYRPDEAFEDEEAFEKVTDCVERALRKLDTKEGFGKYLNVLWQFLRLHAAGERDLPSRRKLAEHLSIPRNRFPELYETLGSMLKQCRKLLLEPPANQEKGKQ